jgi:hypothetical protein
MLSAMHHADAGYRGHNAPLDYTFKIYTSKQKRRVNPQIKRSARAAGDDLSLTINQFSLRFGGTFVFSNKPSYGGYRAYRRWFKEGRIHLRGNGCLIGGRFAIAAFPVAELSIGASIPSGTVP